MSVLLPKPDEVIDLVDEKEEELQEEKGEERKESPRGRAARSNTALRHYSIKQLTEVKNRMDKFTFSIQIPGVDGPCGQLTTGKGNAGIGTYQAKGYAQIGNPKVMAHHIIYKVEVDTSWLPDEKYQLSHLCHNNSCINSTHLTVEYGVYNLSRNYCPHVVEFDCPHPECDTNSHRHFVNICGHTPKCLARGSLYGATEEQLVAAGETVSHKKRRIG
jgi:hypothetical protein